jgi:hypothetical protein
MSGTDDLPIDLAEVMNKVSELYPVELRHAVAEVKAETLHRELMETREKLDRMADEGPQATSGDTVHNE